MMHVSPHFRYLISTISHMTFTSCFHERKSATNNSSDATAARQVTYKPLLVSPKPMTILIISFMGDRGGSKQIS